MQEKLNFMKKCDKNTFNRLGMLMFSFLLMLMQIILLKRTLYVTEKCQKKKKKKSLFQFLAISR